MYRKSILSRTLLLIALGCAALGVMAVFVGAQGHSHAADKPHPRAAGFGAITLEAGQSARLNVINAVLVQPEDATRGDSSGLPAVQRGTRTLALAFDLYAAEPPTDTEPSSAQKFRFLRRESQEVTLRPGEGASLEFTAAEGTRVGAVVIGPPDAKGEGGTEGPHILTTLEVREGGRTVFMHPGAAHGIIVYGRPATEGQQ